MVSTQDVFIKRMNEVRQCCQGVVTMRNAICMQILHYQPLGASIKEADRRKGQYVVFLNKTWMAKNTPGILKKPDTESWLSVMFETVMSGR